MPIAHHLSVHVLRLEGDPYTLDAERLLQWMDGRVHVDKLPAAKESTALLGLW